MTPGTFRIFTPLSFFEKADAAPGESRRIGGVVSTEVQDKQEETILQRGLDFDPFVQEGWFNDNHSRDTSGILGYPDGKPREYAKGARLPDGSIADETCTWAEGFLLPIRKATEIWEIGKALEKSGADRRIGFSIEGAVKERRGRDGKIIAKAVVRNIAITHCPVAQGTRMEVLAKSMIDAEKALTVGYGGSNNPPAEMGSVSGEGSGAILARQHLEEDDEDDDHKKDRPICKSLAVARIQMRLCCSRPTAEKAFGLILKLKQQGLL